MDTIIATPETSTELSKEELEAKINAKMERRAKRQPPIELTPEDYAKAAASETFVILAEVPPATAHPARKRLYSKAVAAGVQLDSIRNKGKAYLIGRALQDGDAE